MVPLILRLVGTNLTNIDNFRPSQNTDSFYSVQILKLDISFADSNLKKSPVRHSVTPMKVRKELNNLFATMDHPTLLFRTHFM